jgi:hypothetical protein
MKKIIIVLLLLAAILFPLHAQKVANYVYKLDNGVVVKMEQDWANVWVSQKQEAFAAGEQPQSVNISIRTLGELVKPSGSVFKLTSAGKDVRMKDAAPGTYDLKITSALSGKPGSLSIDITGIVVKPKMKTTVSVTIYEYQILIEETPGTNKGLAFYESKVMRYKGNSEQNLNRGIPTFYAKGAHDKKLTPDEATNDVSGKIKPGTYDVLITIDVSGKRQKIWLENFTLKADINYKITTNLNGGEIIYTGLTKNVKALHMYPYGTADRLQNVAKPDKASEIIVYDPATSLFVCPPGNYDVLVDINNGAKYEWKKNIVVTTGARKDVK